MTYDKDALTQIIQERQSVYPLFFSGETIPEDTINWVLKNAIQAPSHRKVNPWRYYVIKDEKLNDLGAFFQEVYKSEMSEEKFSQRVYDGFPIKMTNTSHILLITMVEDPQKPLPQWENVAAVAASVQNIYLSVTASGYGGYWSSPKMMIENINKFLPLKAHETCLGFFYLGVPKDELPAIMPKGDLEDYVTWL